MRLLTFLVSTLVAIIITPLSLSDVGADDRPTIGSLLNEGYEIKTMAVLPALPEETPTMTFVLQKENTAFICYQAIDDWRSSCGNLN